MGRRYEDRNLCVSELKILTSGSDATPWPESVRMVKPRIIKLKGDPERWAIDVEKRVRILWYEKTDVCTRYDRTRAAADNRWEGV
jgi:hypothetical protein